jgi:hypothetical protein
MELCRDLHKLSFVLLTHSHKDHLDINLLSALLHLPILWIIPEFILPLIKANVPLHDKQILIPHPVLSEFEYWVYSTLTINKIIHKNSCL